MVKQQIVRCGACDKEYDTYTQDYRCPHKKLPEEEKLLFKQLSDEEIIKLLPAGEIRIDEKFNFAQMVARTAEKKRDEQFLTLLEKHGNIHLVELFKEQVK